MTLTDCLRTYAHADRPDELYSKMAMCPEPVFLINEDHRLRPVATRALNNDCKQRNKQSQHPCSSYFFETSSTHDRNFKRHHHLGERFVWADITEEVVQDEIQEDCGPQRSAVTP
jgi:hypothetical protein